MAQPDKLYFFSKSKKCPPGMGTNEFIQNPQDYNNLPNDFRQVLSNFHVAPFVYRGHIYRSIEHVFQGEKMRLVGGTDGEAAAFRFTVDSKDPIGLGDGAVAQKHRKLCKLNQAQLDTWALHKDVVMHTAALAKYRQNAEARAVLFATGNAQLWHIQVRKQPVRFFHLESIRDLLRQEAENELLNM